MVRKKSSEYEGMTVRALIEERKALQNKVDQIDAVLQQAAEALGVRKSSVPIKRDTREWDNSDPTSITTPAPPPKEISSGVMASMPQSIPSPGFDFMSGDITSSVQIMEPRFDSDVESEISSIRDEITSQLKSIEPS